MSILASLSQSFQEVFGYSPQKAYFAPGRINLIGEHTDYNGGYVFPCAISLGTYAQVAPRQDGLLRLYSQNFPASGVKTLSMDDLTYKAEDGWTNYVKGVLYYLIEDGFKLDHGLDIAIEGNLPNGSGLSSSASIELLIGVLAKDQYQLEIDQLDLVQLGKRVENQYVGVNSGIMDQFAVGMGKKDHAILLDCQSLDYQLVPLDLGKHSILIMNTNKRRELADSKYNERFAETRQALALLQSKKEIESLGQLTNEEFESLAPGLLDDLLYRRAKHAVSENQRTLQAVTALKEGNLTLFGQLMKESHLSTQLDYEVTGPELDTLVHTAWDQEGVIGARMTGAGFGGCALAIVENERLAAVQEAIDKVYREKIGYAPSFYIAQIADGAKESEELA